MKKVFNLVLSLMVVLLLLIPSTVLASTEVGEQTNKLTENGQSYRDWDDDDDYDDDDDFEPEVVRASISNVTATGYDVTADFYDDFGLDKVYFPTWTKLNGKDDLQRPWPAIDAGGGKTFSYTYHVNIADHNNETGVYYTEVYCRNIYGELSDDYELKTIVGSDNRPGNNSNPGQNNGELTVNVTVSPQEGGTVTGAGSYKKGDSVSLVASPNSGYNFVGWFNNGLKVSETTNYGFFISQNTNLTAKFESTTGVTPSPDSNSTGLTEVYRLFNNKTGEHLYTISQEEVKSLVADSWNYEGTGWKAPNTGTPVYRLYNPELNEHLYTTDMDEVTDLTNGKGWNLDFGGEPIFYSGGSIPIYRLYDESTKRHHLTTDEFEYNLLPSQGWKQEGASLYAAG